MRIVVLRRPEVIGKFSLKLGHSIQPCTLVSAYGGWLANDFNSASQVFETAFQRVIDCRIAYENEVITSQRRDHCQRETKGVGGSFDDRRTASYQCRSAGSIRHASRRAQSHSDEA